MFREEMEGLRRLHYERSNCHFPAEPCSYTKEGFVHCVCSKGMHCEYCENKVIQGNKINTCVECVNETDV